MKTAVILLFVFCYAECRKVVPIDKNANLAFINMEAGGGGRPVAQPSPANNKLSPVQPPTPPTPAPVNKQPVNPPVTTPKVTVTKQNLPVATPTPRPPSPSQVTPKSVNPPLVSNPITTPGPGSVKNLINFYDSQGRASVIRPYSYSQAVKQG